MLTKMTVRNFKCFDEIEVDLGERVVFIGPNNSGKTSAMQALALWSVGAKRWNEKRTAESVPHRRTGVTIARRDLLASPHPHANLLWKARHTRDISRRGKSQKTSNVCIDVIVRGMANNRAWECGLEFDYANEESFYCRLLRTTKDGKKRMPFPPEAAAIDVAFLPPMSGLVATETRLDPGAINVRLGEGRTAEVLRNLCWRIAEEQPEQWSLLVERMEDLFGAVLDKPRYIAGRGEIAMTYSERGVNFDLSSSGSGLQQTLLILAYMYANSNAVILLDEPDAHLEILRQRQIYSLISEIAADSGTQIIAASHSEVLLNEAEEKDLVVAFGGKPHVLGDCHSSPL